MNNQPYDPSPLDNLVQQFLQEKEDGTSPSPEEYVAKHPDSAAELTEFFTAYDTVEDALAPLREAAGLTDQPAETIAYEGSRPKRPRALPRIPGYEDLEFLAQGGMGVVYKARQVRLNRTVALKMILSGQYAREHEKARFKMEAEAVAALQDPHIVRILEFGEYEDQLFFSLEYLAGGSLADRVEAGEMSIVDAVQVVELAARGMNTAHQAGIVHRDLKPANILFAEDGTPKVADFGLAKREGQEGATEDGAVMGSVHYMAPEQAAGQTKLVGPAADVYALGAILYRCLAGRTPFLGETTVEILDQVRHTEPSPPSAHRAKLPRDLDVICLKCLNKDPRKRYASAAALAEDLRRFRHGEPIEARPVTKLERVWLWCKRHPSRAIAVGVLILAIAAIIGLFFGFNRQLRHEQRQLQAAFTRQVAERLDQHCEELSRLPQTIASGISLREDWSEEQLKAWAFNLLSAEDRGYGITLAFEEDQFEKGRKDFAFYGYRDPKTKALKSMQLLPPDYFPHYRKWHWYKEPRGPEGKAPGPVWSKPFKDALDFGEGNWVITYSVPMLRQGQFIGVVTIDIQPDHLVRLGNVLEGMTLPEGSYNFVVSSDGIILSHPNPKLRMPERLAEQAGFKAEDTFHPIVQAAKNQETGSISGIDPHTGKQATMFYAPVRGPEWLCAVVIVE